MKEIFVTITSKGWVTIPVEIRRHLGIEPDDKIVFLIDEQGTISLKVLRRVSLRSLT
jgi:AbrB family looped-hinge helix DNA binding protein